MPVRDPSVGVRCAALAAAAAALLVASSCARETTARRELTQRQRDSTLGGSILPGAATVTRALAASDRAATRAQDLDREAGSETP
jgi:hypothetical protein